MDELQPQLGMSNSDRSRWKLTEQTMIRVRINLVQHTQCSNMMPMTQRQEGLIRACHRIHLALEKLKMAFSSRPPHRITILKDLEDKCIVATKQHRGVHKDTLHQPQNTNSLRDTGDITTHMVYEGEPAVKLHAKNIKVGTQMETPDKIKSPWGGLTVLDLVTTKALVLLGFHIMHQWLHHSWILAKSLLREAATAVLSAGLRTATSNVESLA